MYKKGLKYSLQIILFKNLRQIIKCQCFQKLARRYGSKKNFLIITETSIQMKENEEIFA